MWCLSNCSRPSSSSAAGDLLLISAATIAAVLVIGLSPRRGKITNVKTGVSDSGMVAVQGIKAGDVVADSSFEKLQNGSKITISKVKLPSTSSDESTAP